MSPEEQGLQTKAATQKELSDMDYLKSKMVQRAEVSSEDEEDSEDEAVNCDTGSEDEEKEKDSPASPVPQKSTSEAASTDKVRVPL